MDNPMRPYIIRPKLVPQPTWGGTYIAAFKGWSDRFGLASAKIGQSYELYGKSAVYADITDTADARFAPDMPGVEQSDAVLLTLDELIGADAAGILGPAVATTYGCMPVLIKFTQAMGNSFQLHLKGGSDLGHWKPKAESWYYLEPGRLTYGINPDRDPSDYERVCREIDVFMHTLSDAVVSGSMTLADAQKESTARIASLNPWQYVNVHTAEKGDLVDLSAGGIHHSWESDAGDPSFIGNIVYEVQQDVDDADCTLRSFDQGKFLPDGRIRTIHIADYFAAMDRDPAHNDISWARTNVTSGTVAETPYYDITLVAVDGTATRKTDASFHHLFVRDGEVTVTGQGGTIRLAKGHSGLVPYGVGEYALTTTTHATVIETKLTPGRKGR